jgi:hypothetical protein
MGAPRVGVAGDRHQLTPLGSVRSVRRWASSRGKRRVRSLVRHDLPEPLRGSEGLGAEFDTVLALAANEAAQGSNEPGVQHDRHVGQRGSPPQCGEPAEDSLDASGVGRSKSLGGGPGHGRRC